MQELREIAEAVGTVEITLPESSPAWVAVLAVDLATEAGLTYVEAPLLSMDEMEAR